MSALELMNALEQMDQLIDTTIPTWHFKAKAGARNALAQTQLSLDDPGVAALLKDYVSKIAPFRDDFEKLSSEIGKLSIRLRAYQDGPPADQGNAQNIHAWAYAAGWVAVEADELLRREHPSQILSITWQLVKTTHGEISRADIRAGLRTPAYSDSRWAEYVATLPSIKAPQPAINAPEAIRR